MTITTFFFFFFLFFSCIIFISMLFSVILAVAIPIVSRLKDDLQLQTSSVLSISYLAILSHLIPF